MDPKKHVFTIVEKKYFMDIIKKYSHIIENRETDGATLRMKNEAWERLTAEFNTSPLATSQATHKQLRRLWMNLKQRQREALTRERQYRLATGGGPSTSTAEIDPDIASVAPALIVSIENVIDSDSTQEEIVSQHNTTTEQNIIYSVEAAEPVIPLSPPPTTPIPMQGLTPPPTAPHTRPRNPKASIIEKEYEDRRQRADIKHDLEMELLRQQIREAKAKADLAEYILRQNMSVNSDRN